MLEIKRGKISRPQRVVIYSHGGVGKTTFASKLPSPLFIDMEKGSHHLDLARLEVTNWKEFREALKIARENASQFETLVIDTADGLEEKLANHICQTAGVDGIESFPGGYGKGYTKLAEEWESLLTRDFDPFLSLGLHVVLLVHAEAQKHTDPGKETPYDRWKLMQTKKCAPLTMGWADEVWFANYKTTIVEEKGKATIAIGGKERLLHTSHTAAFDAKTRHDLPPQIPMTWEAVRSVFEPAPAQTAPAPAQAAPKPTQAAPVAAQAAPAPTQAAPQPTQEPPTEPEDNIPMGEAPQPSRAAPHPLDPVFEGKDLEKIHKFLRSKNEITEDQTYRALSPAYVARVLANQGPFLTAALK